MSPWAEVLADASETRQNWVCLIFGGTSESLWRPECWISPYSFTFKFCLFQHILIYFLCYSLRSYLFFRATFLRQICISSFNLFGWLWLGFFYFRPVWWVPEWSTKLFSFIPKKIEKKERLTERSWKYRSTKNFLAILTLFWWSNLELYC